jgi:nucleoside-diphosphate-sugar epimerase
MKVAVTGGTGFIGSRVVRILRERGHDVVCVVRSPDKATALATLGATLARGDILDAESLKKAFDGCEGVLHIAASYELGVVGKRAKEALAKNLDGTRRALEAARDSGAKKIVYTSSIVVYGNTHGKTVPEGTRPERIEFPKSHATFYAMSKARAHYDVAVPLMEAGAPIVIVQPGGVIGPRDHSTFRVLWALLARGLPVTMGAARYGIVDVEDCAMGHVLALEKGRVGECYHLVDENLSLPDLVHRAIDASGVQGSTLVFPDWLIGLNAAFMSLVERVIPVPDVMSSDALRGMKASLTLIVETQKARTELGWTPRPMAEALREILADELMLRGKKLPPQLEGVRPHA